MTTELKLFTLGCSLTHNEGLKEKLASLINARLVNLAHSAGSNQLQIARLHEQFIDNNVQSTDIVYWQITSPGRPYLRLKMDAFDEVDRVQREHFKDPYHHYVNSSRNVFDNSARLDLLSGSPLLKDIARDEVEENLQTLLASIIMTSLIVPKTIVVFGWKELMRADYLQTFKEYLKMHKISYIESPYLEYAIHNNLGTLFDGMHPSVKAGEIFAEQVIYKKLFELGWVNT